MRKIIYFLVILFLEFSCGFILYILYWLLASLLFSEDGFGGTIANEAMYYIVILLPPFIYCWMEHSRLKRKGNKGDSTIYLFAAITYLVGGLFAMLISMNFYLSGN